jgi:hypothetical protein
VSRLLILATISGGAGVTAAAVGGDPWRRRRPSRRPLPLTAAEPATG